MLKESEVGVMAVISSLFLTLVVFGGLTRGDEELKNVTSNIFGALPRTVVPLAFGDFNADKLTDVIVTDSAERSKISILLAHPQTLSYSSSYFDVKNLREKELECHFNRGRILGAALGDFDGDGGIDVNIVFQDHSLVLWGVRDEASKHRLMCNDEALAKGWNHPVFTEIEPLVMDYNGDYVSDIFTAINGSKPGFFVFRKGDRSNAPDWVYLSEDEDYSVSFRYPHSNAYVDLNDDGNADILLTPEKSLSVWIRDENGSFIQQSEIPMDYAYVGQTAFADFNLDGKLDAVTPVCYDSKCLNGTILMADLEDLTKRGKASLFPTMSQESLGAWSFCKILKDEGISYFELTPRVGDLNLDGYPDILLRLKHKISGLIRTSLFLNSEDVRNDNDLLLIEGEKKAEKRHFTYRHEYTAGVNDTIMSTFFDFFEDGSLDMMTVSKKGDRYEIGAFSNVTLNSDAYFIKVIVLTGVKPPCGVNDCYGGPVPYGTSFSGQSVCYRSQRSDIHQTVKIVKSCSAQHTQTAHSVLQLPYTIFGLGLAPNFLDYMSVSVTNASLGSQKHTWPQIIPNSQLYVIPYPPSEPEEWAMKLYITPSRSITLTGLALIGTCGIVTLVIGILHWIDRRADYKEKREESHRFHFDAM